MRCFIAVDVPSDLKQLVDNSAKGLRDVIKGKFVAPQNQHLTLKFLGEIDKIKMEGVKRLLREVCAHETSFNLELGTFSAFLSVTGPRVIWVGALDGAQAFSNMCGRIDTALSSLRFEREKLCVAHLTVARVLRVLDKVRLVNFFKKFFGVSFGAFRVSEIKLYKSILTSSGPVYEVLETFKLNS